MSLCYRCEKRALFLEDGHAPRHECKQHGHSLKICYCYEPVKPCTLRKTEQELLREIERPALGPPMLAARMQFDSVGNFEYSVGIDLAAEGVESYTPYWTPKKEENNVE
jgi:hypothetical protein